MSNLQTCYHFKLDLQKVDTTGTFYRILKGYSAGTGFIAQRQFSNPVN